jgi:CheY-like chemotaxis protein
MLDTDLATREGWSIIGLLKRQPATERLPVLIYALDAEHDQGELIELNYLHKPLRAEQLAQELARCDKTDTGQRIVLVVDDDPNILDLHCRLVERSGCRALRARHGREALDMIEHTRPDLILLDLMMPVMDGFAVLRQVKADPDLRDIPVIIISAANNSRSVVKGIKLGAEDYITKPIDERLLLQKVKEFLG